MGTLEVVIRRGEIGDVEGVLRLEREVVGAPHWVAGVYGAMVSGAEMAEGAVRRRLLLAEVEGRLAGFAVASLAGVGEARWGELESVVVDERRRRRGIGRLLCRTVMAWSEREGALWMELEVRAGSAGVRGMYAELGFSEVGRRRGYYQGPTEDAILMRLEFRRKGGNGAEL